jgi:hypothetical protein
MKLIKQKGQPESEAFRYEKKFVIEGMSAAQVMAVLKAHPAMFRELYPMRYVNNIYLDSPLLGDYYSNVNGYRSRRKVRVRWYHELFREVKDALLEFKNKEGEVGTKEQYPFPAFKADESLTERHFREIIRNSDLPQEVKCRLQDLEFAILNRYQRWYFATPDEQFRITVDADLNFYHLGKLSNRFMPQYTVRNYMIVELKYQVDDDRAAQRICASLPFRITRSSKYITGIDSVYIG